MQMDRFLMRSMQNLWNISIRFVEILILKFDIQSACLSVSLIMKKVYSITYGLPQNVSSKKTVKHQVFAVKPCN